MEHAPQTPNSFFDNAAELIPACQKMGEVIAASGWFNCERNEQGTAIAYVSQAERLSLLQLLAEYHFIRGRPMLKAEAMAARFRRQGGRLLIIERSPKRASVKATLDGQSATFEETWEQLEREPWTKGKDGKPKDTYATPRGREKMLWHRCVADAIKTLAPEVTSGLPVEGDPIETAEPEAPALDLGPAPAAFLPKSTAAPRPTTPAAPPPAPAPTPPPPAPPADPAPTIGPPAPAKGLDTRDPARKDPLTGLLDANTVAQIRALIGENDAGARAFSILRKHMTKENAAREDWVSHIPPITAVGILNNAEQYKKAIEPDNALP